MATSLKAVAPAALTASLVTQYTVPGSTEAIVKEIILCNTDTVARSVDVHVVPSGGSAAASNQIHADSLQPKQTRILSLNTLLDTGDFVQAKASSASVVSYRMSVIEVS